MTNIKILTHSFLSLIYTFPYTRAKDDKYQNADPFIFVINLHFLYTRANDDKYQNALKYGKLIDQSFHQQFTMESKFVTCMGLLS